MPPADAETVPPTGEEDAETVPPTDTETMPTTGEEDTETMPPADTEAVPPADTETMPPMGEEDEGGDGQGVPDQELTPEERQAHLDGTVYTGADAAADPSPNAGGPSRGGMVDEFDEMMAEEAAPTMGTGSEPSEPGIMTAPTPDARVTTSVDDLVADDVLGEGVAAAAMPEEEELPQVETPVMAEPDLTLDPDLLVPTDPLAEPVGVLGDEEPVLQTTFPTEDVTLPPPPDEPTEEPPDDDPGMDQTMLDEPNPYAP
jgi:hypothetical protein